MFPLWGWYFTAAWIALVILFLCFAGIEESDEEADERIGHYDYTPTNADYIDHAANVDWPNW